MSVVESGKIFLRRKIIIAVAGVLAAAMIIIAYSSGVITGVDTARERKNAAPAADLPAVPNPAVGVLDSAAAPAADASTVPAADISALLDPADKYKDIYDRLEEAAEKGSAAAWFSLGKLYYAGVGCKQPPYRWALLCFRKAAESSPSQAAERYIAACRRKIAADIADPVEKDTPVSVMEKQMLPIAEMLQVDDVLQAENIVKDFFRNDINEFFLENAIQAKRYLISEWKFDIGRCYRLLREKMTIDREGSTLLMSEEFKREPLSKNLLNINPTIRYMNAAVQAELEKSMQNFSRVGKEDEAAMIKVLAGDMKDMDGYLELSAWHISGDLYFGISIDNSGAWRLRRYVFFLKDRGKYHILSSSHQPFSREDTAVPAGLLVNDPAALNNAAVLLNKYDANSAGTVEKLLLRSSGAGCLTADRNLLAFYLYHRRSSDAARYLEKLKKADLGQ